MKTCSILECENLIDDQVDQCPECLDMSIRLENRWKEKTEELLVDELREQIKDLVKNEN